MMKVLRQGVIQMMLAIISTSVIAAAAYAQAYGQGAYSSCAYDTCPVQIGPITLPVTGPQLLGVVSAALIAVSVGLFLWLRQRRLRARNLQNSA